MTDIPLPPPKSPMLIIILFAIAGAVVAAGRDLAVIASAAIAVRIEVV